MLAKLYDTANSLLMWGGLSTQSHNEYLQKAVAELKLVKTFDTAAVINQGNSILKSEYSVDAVRKLIHQLQNDVHFTDPLVSVGDGILTSDNITPLHRAWSYLIESVMEHYKSTLSHEQLIQLEVEASQRLLSESEDSPLSKESVIHQIKEQKGAPWFQPWRSIRARIMFDQPIRNVNLSRYLKYHHYFTVKKNYTFEEKLLDVWRLTFNKHFTNAPIEHGSRLLSGSSFPYVYSIISNQAYVYDPTTRVVKELRCSTYAIGSGKSPYYESNFQIPLGVGPKLVAQKVYVCHAVIVRQIATNRVWVEHINPGQIKSGSDTPAYIFFAQQYRDYPNPNCITGEIEVFVVDKEHGFDKELFLQRVSPSCTVKSLRVFHYNPKTSIKESAEEKIDYNVCYDPQSDSVLVHTYDNDHKPTIINHPFSSDYPNLVQGKERTPVADISARV